MSLLKTKRDYPRLHRQGALRRAGPRWLKRGGLLAVILAGGLWWWLGGSPTVSEAPPAIGEAPGMAETTDDPAANPGGAAVQNALAVAMEAAEPYVRSGFTMREDYWGGEMKVGVEKLIEHQLFKGNEYWLWMGTEAPATAVSVHVYDSAGQLVDVESWQHASKAAARVAPKATGKFYFVIKVESGPEPRAPWALAYGYR